MSDEEFEEIYKAYKGLYHLINSKSDELLQKYGLTEEEAYRKFNIICQYYYNDQLDPEDERCRSILFNMADAVYRYRFLNEQIDDAYMDYIMREHDNFILNHFEGILDIVNFEAEDMKCYEKEEEPPLPYLDPANLEPYFKDFLRFVDKSGEYLKIFEELKKQGRLIYLDTKTEEEKNKMFDIIGVDNKKQTDFCWHNPRFGHFVFITRENTINDFRKLAHEFTHHVTRTSNPYKRASIMVDEFPPIFYELLASSYLLQKGYTLEDVNNCALQRLIYTSNEASAIDSISSYLRLYISKEDEITYQDDLLFREAQITQHRKEIGEELFAKEVELNGGELTPQRMVEEFVKFTNATLDTNKNIISRIFPYLISYHLAKKYTKKMHTSKNVLVGMKYVTKHLPSLNSSLLLKELDKDKGYAKGKRRE